MEFNTLSYVRIELYLSIYKKSCYTRIITRVLSVYKSDQVGDKPDVYITTLFGDKPIFIHQKRKEKKIWW